MQTEKQQEKKTKIKKRDGRLVPFDRNRIVAAVLAAMNDRHEINRELAEAIGDAVKFECASGKTELTVEAVQDRVETLLMQHSPAVAKAYILYRADRTRRREANSAIIKRVWEKTNASNVENANANVDESTFGGRKNEAASAAQKEIALEMNMQKDVAKAYKEGLIYQHDLDHFNLGAHNCLNIDFKKLLSEGFKTRNADVRPPTSFATACQLVAVIFQIQSQCQFGGVGSVHIDYDLAPFVHKSFIKHLKDGYKYAMQYPDSLLEGAVSGARVSDDIRNPAYQYAMDMLEREGKQAAQGMFHNLNTLESRAGSQVPFTSINYGRDTSPEGRMVSRWLLEASIEGVGKHNTTSIFPISVFCLKNGVNMKPGDPNYDLKQLAMKSMSMRIYPNFCNDDWSEAHEDPNDIDTIFSTMGCRTMIGYDRHGLGYRRVGRGNNVPITIILPKLGIEYGICLGKRDKPDLKGFKDALSSTLCLVEKALLERFDIMCRQTAKAAPFMYDNGTIADTDKGHNSVYESLRHNTLAIGFIGIAEMCEALFGANHIHSGEALSFARDVVRHINEFAKEASERNNLNFSCYATPAEGLCRTALNTLKAQYGVLPRITDREYLTNSFHVPVWEKVSIWDKLQIEAPFTTCCTGGTITYIECESTFMKNLDAIEDIINYAHDLDVPYLAFNFPIDTCKDCGYSGEFDNACPKCGSTRILQLRRVTGYLTQDYRRFNDGKKAEVRDRVKHSAYTRLRGNDERK